MMDSVILHTMIIAKERGECKDSAEPLPNDHPCRRAHLCSFSFSSALDTPLQQAKYLGKEECAVEKCVETGKRDQLEDTYYT